MSRLFWLVASLTLVFIACAEAALAQTPGEGPGREACRADLQKLCSGMQPGGGRLIQCLREHQDQLSSGCKEALQATGQRRQQSSGGAAPGR